MRSTWKGPTRNLKLQNLIHLRLTYYKRLTSVYTLSLAQSLLRLKTLAVADCHELEHIIREKEANDGKQRTIPKPLCFPKFTTLYITHCNKLEYVFPVSLAPKNWNMLAKINNYLDMGLS